MIILWLWCFGFKERITVCFGVSGPVMKPIPLLYSPLTTCSESSGPHTYFLDRPVCKAYYIPNPNRLFESLNEQDQLVRTRSSWATLAGATDNKIHIYFTLVIP